MPAVSSTSTSEPELDESHGALVVPALEPEHDFHLVFSNKTIWDPLCLEVRAKLVVDGVRIWQQQTNIPKDSENCTPPHSSPALFCSACFSKDRVI